MMNRDNLIGALGILLPGSISIKVNQDKRINDMILKHPQAGRLKGKKGG